MFVKRHHFYLLKILSNSGRRKSQRKISDSIQQKSHFQVTTQDVAMVTFFYTTRLKYIAPVVEKKAQWHDVHVSC